MFFPSRDIVERVKKEYPSGTRVELVEMNDPYRNLAAGLKGTVSCVDDTATIHVNWDNGGHLGLVYGEDFCRKLQTVKTICYGKERTWDSREEAIEFFKRCIMASEGSEKQRYTNILQELQQGATVCGENGD